jgi:hypothetical protein
MYAIPVLHGMPVPALFLIAGQPWYFLSSATDGWGELQEGGTPPADSTIGTGWNVAGVAAGQYSRMAFGSVRGNATFGGTAQPSSGPDNTLKDAWRTPTAITGDFVAGDWQFAVPFIAVEGEGATLRVRLRFWRSANADASGATEITAGAVVGSTVTDLQDDIPQISSGTVALGAVTLTNEYLFAQVAAETT